MTKQKIRPIVKAAFKVDALAHQFEDIDAVQGPVVGLRGPSKLVFRLREGDIERGFAKTGAFQQKAHRGRRLASARGALQEIDPIPLKPSGENVVQPRDPKSCLLRGPAGFLIVHGSRRQCSCAVTRFRRLGYIGARSARRTSTTTSPKAGSAASAACKKIGNTGPRRHDLIEARGLQGGEAGCKMTASSAER